MHPPGRRVPGMPSGPQPAAAAGQRTRRDPAGSGAPGGAGPRRAARAGHPAAPPLAGRRARHGSPLRPVPAGSAAGSVPASPGRRARLRGDETRFVLLVSGCSAAGWSACWWSTRRWPPAAFQITALQNGNAALAQQKQELQQQVAEERSASSIERRARALGMRPQARPDFLNLRPARSSGPRTACRECPAPLGTPRDRPRPRRRRPAPPVRSPVGRRAARGARAARPARAAAGSAVTRGVTPAAGRRAAFGRSATRPGPAWPASGRARAGTAPRAAARADPPWLRAARRRAARPRPRRLHPGPRRPARSRPPARLPPGSQSRRHPSRAAATRRGPWQRGRPRQARLAADAAPRQPVPAAEPRDAVHRLRLTLFAARLVQMQGFESAAYQKKAATQRLKVIPIPAVRGEITASDGTVLAMTVRTDLVFADPPLMPPSKRADAAAKLAGPLGLPAEQILRLINGAAPGNEYVRAGQERRSADGRRRSRPSSTCSASARRPATPGSTRTATWPPTCSASPPPRATAPT